MTAGVAPAPLAPFIGLPSFSPPLHSTPLRLFFLDPPAIKLLLHLTRRPLVIVKVDSQTQNGFTYFTLPFHLPYIRACRPTLTCSYSIIIPLQLVGSTRKTNPLSSQFPRYFFAAIRAEKTPYGARLRCLARQQGSEPSWRAEQPLIAAGQPCVFGRRTTNSLLISVQHLSHWANIPRHDVALGWSGYTTFCQARMASSDILSPAAALPFLSTLDSSPPWFCSTYPALYGSCKRH